MSQQICVIGVLLGNPIEACHGTKDAPTSTEMRVVYTRTVREILQLWRWADGETALLRVMLRSEAEDGDEISLLWSDPKSRTGGPRHVRIPPRITRIKEHAAKL